MQKKLSLENKEKNDPPNRTNLLMRGTTMTTMTLATTTLKTTTTTATPRLQNQSERDGRVLRKSQMGVTSRGCGWGEEEEEEKEEHRGGREEGLAHTVYTKKKKETTPT